VHLCHCRNGTSWLVREAGLCEPPARASRIAQDGVEGVGQVTEVPPEPAVEQAPEPATDEATTARYRTLIAGRSRERP
jgi:hypothetical protein